MNRKQKETVVSNFLNVVNTSKGVFVIDFVGIDSFKLTAFKKKLFTVDSKMMVVKNSLLRIAAKNNDALGKISSEFMNQIALVYAFKDPFVTANTLSVFLKDMKNIQFKSGLLGNVLVKKEEFQKIGNISSEKMLYAQLCGLILNPIVKLVSVLNQIAEKQKSN
jgi:large subunit ribosomal protein L10